jgi:hypothetical protein
MSVSGAFDGFGWVLEGNTPQEAKSPKLNTSLKLSPLQILHRLIGVLRMN